MPRAYGPDDRKTSIVFNCNGQMLTRAGRHEESLTKTQRALDILVRAFPPEDQDTATTRLNSMCVLEALGRGEEAAAQSPEVVELFERVLGPRHPTTAIAKNNAARIMTGIGRFDEAESNLLEGQRGIEGASTAREVDEREAVQRLVDLYGAWNAAEPTAERAEQLAAWEARLGAFPAGR